MEDMTLSKSKQHKISSHHHHLDKVPEYDGTFEDADGIIITNENKLEPSPLHLVAISGNKILLQEHIHKDNWDLNEVDHMGRTPLIYSVLGDRIDCVMVLLKAGADIDKPDIDERTALHWAAYQGNHKLVKLLLTKGADRVKRDKEGRTPLHLSTSHDNIKVLQTLLRDMKEVEIDTPDNKKMTALCWCVYYDRIEYTKLLIKYGASPTNIDSERRTVLHWTSENKDPSILKMLLEEDNTIINWGDCEGRTVLHMAVGQSNFNLVKFLLQSNTDIDVNKQDIIQRTPLHWAAVLGNTNVVTFLLKHGADYSIGDKNGVRALHYAAQNGSHETVQALLQQKGVKDIPDNEKGTALMWAAVKGCDEVLEILLKKDSSNVNAVDSHIQTALHMSTQAGHLNCVKLLISYGADVNTMDGQHHIPLFYACASGHVEILTELLSHGSSSNLGDKDLEGRCPLHYAAMVDRTDIIKILIQNQLNPNTQDNAGCPPLHFAAYGGFVHCMSVLLENGANVNTKDNGGRTALHWACRSGSLEAVKLLVSRFNANVNEVEHNGGQLTPLDYAIHEDHQDVACFLTEYNGFTHATLKEISAIRIQAVWKGYNFRRRFRERRELLVKHESLRKGISDVEIQVSSVASGQQEIPQQKQSQFEWKEYKIYSDSTETNGAALENLLISMQHSSDIYQQKQHNIRQYKKSTNSNISGHSYSSRSSYHLSPDRLKKNMDTRQGPKFAKEDTNPLSLRKVSVGSSVISDTYTPHFKQAVKSSEGFQLFNGGKDVGQNNWTSMKSFTKSNVNGFNGYNDHKPSPPDTGLTSSTEVTKLGSQSRNVDRNSLYSPSYSRHISIPKSKHSTSSESSALFETRPTRQDHSYFPQSSRQNHEKQTDSHSLSSVETNTLHKEAYTNTNIFVRSHEPDKPWAIYRRDQKRINMIRLKTEAAIRIQKVFRRYKRNKSITNNIVHYHTENDLFCERSGNTTDQYETTSINDSFVTDSELSEDDQEEILNEETLQEVAALVIQLAWRQYTKNKLLSEQSKQDEEERNTYVNVRNEISPNVIHQESVGEMNSFDQENYDLESSLEENILRGENAAIQNIKKKLVPSSSFPLMQNVYFRKMSKKRSSRFSIKKRLLNRGNSSLNPSNATNSPNLATLERPLTKSELSAIKSRKPKLFLHGRSSKANNQKYFFEEQ